jgi:hypothetical protein
MNGNMATLEKDMPIVACISGIKAYGQGKVEASLILVTCLQPWALHNVKIACLFYKKFMIPNG